MHIITNPNYIPLSHPTFVQQFYANFDLKYPIHIKFTDGNYETLSMFRDYPLVN